jgi:hypothetical protein
VACLDGPSPTEPTYIILGTCTAEEEEDVVLIVELADVDAREGEGLGALNGGTAGTQRPRVTSCTPACTHNACKILSRLNSLSLTSCPSF